MPYPFIAFAESTYKDDYSCNPVSVISEEYDHEFPPLTARKNLLTDGWEEIEYDDDAFSCNSAVWIGVRSYAEIATNAGVQHEPVFFNNKCHPKAWFRYNTTSLIVSQQPISQIRQGDKVHDEVNAEQFDLWSQSKFTGYRKRNIHQTVTTRKKKTYQMVYRRIAQPHIVAWEQEIYPKKHELMKARDYMKNVKSVGKEMSQWGTPEYPVLIMEKDGEREICKTDVNGIRLWRQQCFENLCKNPDFKQVISDAYERNICKHPRAQMLVPKNYFASETEYLYRLYHYFGRPSSLDLIRRSYENDIVPKLEESYQQTKNRVVRAFLKALPIPKDKSLSSMSRMQYIRYALMQE